MAALKKCGILFAVGLSACRLVACSANTGNPHPGATNTGGFTATSGGATSAGGAFGSGSFVGAGSTGDGAGGVFMFNAGGESAADKPDSSCRPVTRIPETIVITDSSIAPVAMFLMQDRSTSMVAGGAGASPMSWDNSAAAITAFVQDPASAGIDIGLGTFPVGANNTYDCNTGSDCGTPVVPIAPLTGDAMTGNAPPIVAAYSMLKPQMASLAFTPTECALRGMINTCLLYMSNSPNSEKCVAVLVTDGTPTQCNGDENYLTQIIADGAMRGVETFTLGLPGADLNVLNQYAKAGGTNAAIDVSGGSQAIVQALNAIRGTVQTVRMIQTPLECQWKIPAPAPNDPPLDPTKVNVQFTPPGAAPLQFGHVTSQAACPTNGNGWYYDNETAPTQVFACPTACALIKGTMNGRIDVLFHCPTKPFVIQ